MCINLETFVTLLGGQHAFSVHKQLVKQSLWVVHLMHSPDRSQEVV